MGQAIWGVLDAYKGKWIAVDREGKVIDADADLGALRSRAVRARTYVYACGEDTRQGEDQTERRAGLAPARVSGPVR